MIGEGGGLANLTIFCFFIWGLHSKHEFDLICFVMQPFWNEWIKKMSFVDLASSSRSLSSPGFISNFRTSDASTNFSTPNSSGNYKYVALLDIGGLEVARGVVQEHVVGCMVGGRPVRASDVVVLVRSVKDENANVYELYMSTMGECMGKVIRWPCSQTRELRLISSPNVDRVEIPENTQVGNSVNRSAGSAQGSSFVHSMDGLSSSLPKRSYVSIRRKKRCPGGPRQIGMRRGEKVTLAAVEEVKQRPICSKHCLEPISAFDILSLRYQAWEDISYAKRAMWLVTTLRAFKVARHDLEIGFKFETKISGMKVCNSCFAAAIGYSRRRMNKIMSNIREKDVHNPIHGNTGNQREATHISMARAKFESFIQCFGETQPHRQVRRKADGEIVPVICLPMGVLQHEVLTVINTSLSKMGEKEIGLSTFSKMWKKEFTNVHVPEESRFSKCQHCWEYKESRQSMPNQAMREAVHAAYRLHIDLTIEERKAYSRVREKAIANPEDSMSIIIDGMDQNTTYVPKFKQNVKNIESRYVKTHLCGILVHGIGLYCHLWIDSHHKHDSNQVVTSIMKVLQDVQRIRKKLPPILHIQADNCGRENKNVYMLGMCAALVGLGFFKEIQLSFLIVGHTHEDIDQRFSSISSALKLRDINSLKELLQIIQEKPSRSEPFIRAEHLEHVQDWKKFISPHLRKDAFVGISQPHHFRFYVQEGEAHVQYKPYARSPLWLPPTGYVCFETIPSVHSKPDLAEVSQADDRELKALEDYILLKERQILRQTNVERNLEAIEETSKLITYLKEFPKRDRSMDALSPFWPFEDEGIEQNIMLSIEETTSNEAIASVLQSLPPVMVSDFFGPRSQRPVGHRVRPRNNSHGRVTNVTQNLPNASLVQSNSVVPNAFPPFNPSKDVSIGMFAALETTDEDRSIGIPFFIAKVLKMSRQTCTDGTATVMWYQPKMHFGVRDETGKFFKRYRNCIERGWEPSRERNDCIPIQSIFIAWKNTVGTKNLVTIFGNRTEKDIKIPTGEKNHLYNHLEMINWQHQVSMENDVAQI